MKNTRSPFFVLCCSLRVSAFWGSTRCALAFVALNPNPCYRHAYDTCGSITYLQQQQQSSITTRTLLRSSKSNNDDDDVDQQPQPQRPPKNWLQSLKEEADDKTGRLAKPPSDDEAASAGNILADNEEPGNVNIPSTGVSVSDSLVDSQKDEFKTALSRLKGIAGVAKIETNSSGGTEPVRYLVALSPPADKASNGSNKIDTEKESTKGSTMQLPCKFALVDVPPYSDKLAEEVRSFMGETGRLATLLVTNRDSLHYDESNAVYVTRKSDMAKWSAAFPGIRIVMYRIDIPRDCNDIVTQRLDGYGPWALDEGKDGLNATFVETGRPLTIMEWDENTRVKVMDDGGDPPDDDNENVWNADNNDDELYTSQAIRQREEGKRILAVYTPGRTFGSVSFVFPELGVVCSGYSIPIEDNRSRENLGMSAGPKLDYTGYITTSVAGVKRQAESAKHLIKNYSGRFNAVLPANGETVVLGDDAKSRADLLFDIVSQYEKIGTIYDELGII
mmetsp:Transcript_22322/g.48280  ORF Transcript_22322/g.48280 Transcript_22322/m.48280 type:complete len:504 (+) Transcript_22322:217-1728(+)